MTLSKCAACSEWLDVSMHEARMDNKIGIAVFDVCVVITQFPEKEILISTWFLKSSGALPHHGLLNTDQV